MKIFKSIIILKAQGMSLCSLLRSELGDAMVGGGLMLDLTHQPEEIRAYLKSKAARTRGRKAIAAFRDMDAGKKVNTSENRAALHMEARSGKNVFLNGQKRRAYLFAEKIRNENRIRCVIVVGVGGSKLGTKALYDYLSAYSVPDIPIRFLSSVDACAFRNAIGGFEAKDILWVIVSKSFATRETSFNLAQAAEWLSRVGLDTSDCMVAITAKGADERCQYSFMEKFYILPEIGGRFSTTSVVGALPISLAFGSDLFEEFLMGCRATDRHVLEADLDDVIPLCTALIEYAQIEKGNKVTHVVGYGYPLSSYPDHIAQLWMESLGKGVGADGLPIPLTGPLCITGVGPDAQHSYFQMLHQAQNVPTEILVTVPDEGKDDFRVDGVTGLEEVWINALAQAEAFSSSDGQDQVVSFKTPCSVVIMPDASIRSFGSLFAYHEHKTVLLGFLLGLNPFDQFGVERGKMIAGKYRHAGKIDLAPQYG